MATTMRCVLVVSILMIAIGTLHCAVDAVGEFSYSDYPDVEDSPDSGVENEYEDDRSSRREFGGSRGQDDEEAEPDQTQEPGDSRFKDAAIFVGAAQAVGAPEPETDYDAAEARRKDPWKGHLQPLGEHRPYDPIPELDYMPSPEEFWTEYVHKWKPVLLKGAAKSFPAYKLWDENYMRQKYPNSEVRCERKIENRDDPSWAPRQLNLTDFFEEYKQSSAYTVSCMPHDMAMEVNVLPCMLCGDRQKSHIPEPRGKRWLTLIEETGLWISSNTTRSQLHYDELNIMNCIIKGSKEWKMINTHKYAKNIPMAYNNWVHGSDVPATRASDYSRINVTSVDLKKYPKLRDIRVGRTIQEEGDCIFIPYAYLHQVSKQSEGFSVASSTMFRRTERFSKEACEGVKPAAIPLAHFDMTWYYAGKGVVPMGYPDPQDIKGGLIDAARRVERAPQARKRRVAHQVLLQMFLDEQQQGGGLSRDMMKKRAEYWVRELDRSGKGYFDVQDVEQGDRGMYCQLAVELDYQGGDFKPYHRKPSSEIQRGQEYIDMVESQWSSAAGSGAAGSGSQAGVRSEL